MWRTKPQMWQVAVPVSGSRSSKLAQPFVPQKRRLLEFALNDRRRIRRTAEARPVTDAWVLRVIMWCLFLCFLARLGRGMSDRLRRCGGARVLARDACLDVSARRAGSVVWALEPGRRVGRVLRKYRSPVRNRQTADGHGSSGSLDSIVASLTKAHQASVGRWPTVKCVAPRETDRIRTIDARRPRFDPLTLRHAR